MTTRAGPVSDDGDCRLRIEHPAALNVVLRDAHKKPGGSAPNAARLLPISGSSPRVARRGGPSTATVPLLRTETPVEGFGVQYAPEDDSTAFAVLHTMTMSPVIDQFST